MGIFKNIFVCNNGDEDDTYERKIRELDRLYNELKDEVRVLKQDVNVLFRDNTSIKTDIKNLELKLDNRFDVLTSKLDSVILLLKKN